MKTFFTLLLILIASIALAQDWNLFVYNQNSFYKQQDGSTAHVENFLLDSILSDGDKDVLYFNMKSGVKPECNAAIKAAIADWQWDNRFLVDSMIRVNDSILYIKNNSFSASTFIFKPLATLNESWVTNGVTITCSELGVMDIFGVEDSIKTFVCSGNGYNGVEFILSKNFGLIKFVHFSKFINNFSPYPYFEFIGYSDDLTTKGYTAPDFNAYFHLNAGDLLYWRDYIAYWEPNMPSITRYYVDSITNTFISIDSVHYNFKRATYNSDGFLTHTGNYSQTHLRSVEGRFVQNHTSWFGTTNEFTQNLEVYWLKSHYFEVEAGDTITYVEIEPEGFFVDTSNCEVSYTFDHHSTFRYSTRAGITLLATNSWGPSSITLIGSIINGVVFGNINLPTGVQNIKPENYYVYPNPFSDYIMIKNQGNLISKVEIYNAVGILVKKLESVQDRIDLADLASGVYILKITDENYNSRQMKVVKQ